MKTQDIAKENKGEIVIYQSEEGKAAIDVILQDETVWVTQEQMVSLFGKAKSTISEHLKHIFEEGELDQNSVVRFFRTTAADGKSYNTSKKENWTKIQLFGFSELLPLMANHIIPHITTSMLSFQSVIVFIQCKVHVSGNGLPNAFTSISSKATHWMTRG